MTWVRLDDTMPEHPKVAGLSNAAFRLHIEGLCYSARNLSDGAIPRPIARRLAATRIACELVDAGVWDEAETAYLIHDYHDYQLSRTEVIERREKRADAGRRGAEARWHSDSKTHGKRHSKTHGKPDGKTMPHPDPSLKPSEDESSVVDRGSTTWPTIWNAYTTIHPTAKPTPKRRRLLAARAKEGYSDDTLLAALHGNHHDPWCSGDNPDGKTYHAFELIYRDAAHVEQYAAIASINGHSPGESRLDRARRQNAEREGAAQ